MRVKMEQLKSNHEIFGNRSKIGFTGSFPHPGNVFILTAIDGKMGYFQSSVVRKVRWEKDIITFWTFNSVYTIQVAPQKGREDYSMLVTSHTHDSRTPFL